MNKKWNVVAIMAVLLSLGYVGTSATALVLGKVDFNTFQSAVVPLVTAWGGYLAAMLREPA
jgi:hypothetical protein